VARIAGVDLPLNKRVEIGLTYIFGIGRSRSNRILSSAGVSKETRVKDLTEDDVRKIRQIITDEGKVEGDLRKDVGLDIKRLMEINCYRGIRHRRGLPHRAPNFRKSPDISGQAALFLPRSHRGRSASGPHHSFVTYTELP